MGAMTIFLVTIQLVFLHMLLRSHRKIKKLEKEEIAFQNFIEESTIDLEEFDD